MASASDYIAPEDKDPETALKPKAKKEKMFADLHKIVKKAHPVAKENQFTSDLTTNHPHTGGQESEGGERNPIMQGSSKIKEAAEVLSVAVLENIDVQYELADGTLLVITPAFAEHYISVNKNLTEENRFTMLETMIEGNDGFEKVCTFLDEIEEL